MGGPNVTSATGSICFSDIGLDVNQNGIDNEKLLSVNSSTLNVPKQDTVIVETFLNMAGEGEKSPYVDGNDSTVSYFTPGTNADYTVRITNTSNDEASNFELYIPIPKTGQNFGSKFQNEAFKWSMKLNDAVPITTEQQSQFEVSYATEANADNYETADIYTDDAANYDAVNMVRIKVKTKINAGETQTLKVPLKVDETFESATSGNKIGERDIYNPYYRVIANNFAGSLPGTKVGAELVIGEVSGQLFNDKDANGLYNRDQGDEPLANETVELYKWNEASSKYEPYTKDGENVTAKTDADGAYKFDYSSGVGYGKFAVKFPEKTGFQYTVQNAGKSDAVNSDVPYSGADKGWVKAIDPTQPTSENINAGYIQYALEKDLKVNLNEKLVQEGRNVKITLPKVASTSGQAAEDTIEPAFFQNIHATTDGYKWSAANTDIATVQTLSDGSSAVVGVSTKGKTVAATNLTIALQDIFGTQQSSTAPLYVKTADGQVVQKDGYTIGATDFSTEYKAAKSLTETQALNLAKTAAFEEVKNGVNSSAQDRTSEVQVNSAQLSAIQNGSKQGGTYPLTYTVTQAGKSAAVTIQVKVEQDLTVVNAHDSTMYVGDSWAATNNFDSALDKEGNVVTFANIVVTGTVNTNIAGSYPITYTYNGVSTTINVTVKEIQTAVNSHDSTIYTGDSWTAADNFDSALDKDGNSVSLADLTVAGTVDTSEAGTYTITYTYEGVTSTSTVTVKENKTGISAHDSTIYVGDNWNTADNFDSAFDRDGNAVSLEDVKVVEKPTVNTNKAGTYQVTYSYGKVSKKITLTVKAVKTAVNVHDSVIYTNDNWTATDNFDSARDKDGNEVPFTAVQVTGSVDTSKAGTYPVTYTYGGISKEINVTVKNPQTSLIVHDSVIYTGDTWNAKDNFDNATDKEGKAVSFNKVTVTNTSQVDTNKPGVYQVTYSYDGITTTVNITVEPRQTSIKVHDSSIYAGTTWNAKDNFDSATDKKGDSLPFAEVTVGGAVESNTPGTYEVSYLYDGVKVVAHITVLENKAQITVKDSTIKIGDDWNAKANFINATNRDGNPIDFTKVKVNGTVNTKKAGVYHVTYTIDPNEGTTDASKEQLSVSATILVEDPSTPTPPSKPKDGSTAKPIVKNGNQHSANYLDAKPLPKTGDENNLLLLWTGIFILVAGAILLFTKRRKNNK